MSGLCKVEMSGFMDGRGAYGNGAHRLEPTRTGPLESVARGKLEASDAGLSGRAAESNRPSGATDAAPHSRTRGCCPGSRLRGRPSNRKLAFRFEQKILERLRQRYADFGPTLAAEHLAKEAFSVSRETLRKWMTKAALWRPRSQRVKTVHVCRERRASFGELVMQDSSPFLWLEDRGPAGQLIALIFVTPRCGGSMLLFSLTAGAPPNPIRLADQARSEP
jgi:hypothetical protein